MGIHLSEEDNVPPVPVPVGHTGPVALPGTGRQVWWTGKVAIGLRHEPARHTDIGTQAEWLQNLLRCGHGTVTR